MKKSFLLLTAMISLFYYAENARAEFLLEPFAGLQFNSSYDADGGSEGDLAGTAIGVRAGFQQAGFFFAGDGRRSSWKIEPDSGSDTDYTYTTIGLTAGYDFPSMLRVWATYVFSFEGMDDDDEKNKYTEGSGMSFGLGYKVVPFVSFNFEISNLATTKFETAAGDGDLDIAYTSYLLSVSFPTVF